MDDNGITSRGFVFENYFFRRDMGQDGEWHNNSRQGGGHNFGFVPRFIKPRRGTGSPVRVPKFGATRGSPPTKPEQ
jgi:hypothetical protein